MKYSLNLILLLTFLTILFTTRCQEKRVVSQEKVMKEISDKWSTFITHWEDENAVELADMYSIEGINIPPESKIKKGRQEISEFYEFLFNNHISSKYNHKTISIDAFSNSAIERGEFTVQWVRNDSSEWVFNARSITHWEKDKEDQWSIKLFMFNRRPATNPK